MYMYVFYWQIMNMFETEAIAVVLGDVWTFLF